MRVIPNSLIPFPGFLAVNLFGVVFIRKDSVDDLSTEYLERVKRHEAIHSAQGRELLWIGFYIVYVLEWLARLVVNGRNAYRNLSFEQEAYRHEAHPDYLKTRKHFAQWKH